MTVSGNQRNEMDDLWNIEITLFKLGGLTPDGKGKTDQGRDFIPVLVFCKSAW